jgi:hypothetical protein
VSGAVTSDPTTGVATTTETSAPSLSTPPVGTSRRPVVPPVPSLETPEVNTSGPTALPLQGSSNPSSEQPPPASNQPAMAGRCSTITKSFATFNCNSFRVLRVMHLVKSMVLQVISLTTLRSAAPSLKSFPSVLSAWLLFTRARHPVQQLRFCSPECLHPIQTLHLLFYRARSLAKHHHSRVARRHLQDHLLR